MWYNTCLAGVRLGVQLSVWFKKRKEKKKISNSKKEQRNIQMYAYEYIYNEYVYMKEYMYIYEHMNIHNTNICIYT
jgi:hypothetical protein